MSWSSFLTPFNSVTQALQYHFQHTSCHTIQQVLYMLVDSGANTHIINLPDVLHNSSSLSSSPIGSLFGEHDLISSIGSLPVRLGDLDLTLKNVRYAAKAKTSCLGLVALKNYSNCSTATHDINEYLHLSLPDSTSTIIRKSQMKRINNLDYVPVTLKSWVAPPHVNTVRRSTRNKSVPSKYADFILDPSPSKAPSDILPSTPKSPSSPLSLASSPSTPRKVTFSSPPHLSCTPSSDIMLPPHNQSTSSSSNPCPVLSRPVTSMDHPNSHQPYSSSTPTSYSHDLSNDSLLRVHKIQQRGFMTHFKFGCLNYRSLRQMQIRGLLLDMPHLSIIECSCPICLQIKATKLPRVLKSTKEVSWSKGQCFHLDFAFINKPSIRGFTSYLSIHCITTKYDFVFPTHHKRPPLDILSVFIQILAQQNITIKAIVTDEGGELARCTAFLQLLVFHKIHLDTTGSYASFLNKDERGHRTNLGMIKSMLFGSGLGHRFWCYSLQYSVFLRRRFCNHTASITPFEAWHGQKPSFKNIHIFGAPVYAHDAPKQKLDPNNILGYFLGYGATTSSILFYDPCTQQVKRAFHARVDDYCQHMLPNVRKDGNKESLKRLK